MKRTVAALYVMADGPYVGLEGVDPWAEERDARLYAGPHPVVAHPPCARWGRYWSGGPSAKVRRKKGDDGGCFGAALAAVKHWGGVLEHPEASHAWTWFGVPRPPKSGGWIATLCGGWTCCVEQGNYGHKARKATWLYAHGIQTPDLIWGKAEGRQRLDDGAHTKAERAAGLGVGRNRITARECRETPLAFRDLLLGMARTVAT